jgi:predicted DCC family thiol-disulfide oxidoreductase YuxK
VSDGRPVWVLFDGECGLCDAVVRWLLARDRRAALRYAPLAGGVGAAVRRRHPELPGGDETMVLVEAPETPDERVRVRSDAALAILVHLGGAWRLAAVLRLVPRPLRDAAYRCVAGRRRRWFGRLDACRIPAAAERDRFLEPPAGGDRDGTIAGP